MAKWHCALELKLEQTLKTFRQKQGQVDQLKLNKCSVLSATYSSIFCW